MAAKKPRFRLLVIQSLGDDSNNLQKIVARAIRHANSSRGESSAMMIVDAKAETSDALNFTASWQEELQKAVIHIGRGVNFLSFPQSK